MFYNPRFPTRRFQQLEEETAGSEGEKLGNNGCDEGPACYQHYMRIDHLGEWDDAFQFTTHPYICEYKGRYVVSSEKKSWEEAKQECHEAGLQLAKIRSDQDLQVSFDFLNIALTFFT